jgi:hypothetical protein
MIKYNNVVSREVFMESDSYDSHVDRDITKCDEDISNSAGQGDKSSQSQKSNSASRIMPIFEDILKNKTAQSHPPVQSAGEKEFVRKMVEKISNPQQQDRSGEMPSFDLGQQILAQQRKIAALKRKSPLSPNDSPTDKQQVRPSASQISFMSQAPASPHQRIIADIVAREILALSAAR